jgi:hypothetical protein
VAVTLHRIAKPHEKLVRAIANRLRGQSADLLHAEFARYAEIVRSRPSSEFGVFRVFRERGIRKWSGRTHAIRRPPVKSRQQPTTTDPNRPPTATDGATVADVDASGLGVIVEAWDTLPEPIRAGTLAMVRASRAGRDGR